MSSSLSIDDRIDALASADHRYDPDAYRFVWRALDYVLEQCEEQCDERLDERHVSAIRLLEGLRDYALELYGPLARLVLERWGIYRTEDFGEIVFGLVECRLLNKQDTDQKSDFRNGFNFREAFDKARGPTSKTLE